MEDHEGIEVLMQYRCRRCGALYNDLEQAITCWDQGIPDKQLPYKVGDHFVAPEFLSGMGERHIQITAIALTPKTHKLRYEYEEWNGTREEGRIGSAKTNPFDFNRRLELNGFQLHE